MGLGIWRLAVGTGTVKGTALWLVPKDFLFLKESRENLKTPCARRVGH
jgi:hypothetical protein